MRREQVDKYLGKLVAVTFIHDWFNEATQSWVNEEDEYVGVLNRCTGYQQERYYQLDSDKWLPTDNACWGAHRMKKIIERKDNYDF